MFQDLSFSAHEQSNFKELEVEMIKIQFDLKPYDTTDTGREGVELSIGIFTPVLLFLCLTDQVVNGLEVSCFYKDM